MSAAVWEYKYDRLVLCGLPQLPQAHLERERGSQEGAAGAAAEDACRQATARLRPVVLLIDKTKNGAA